MTSSEGPSVSEVADDVVYFLERQADGKYDIDAEHSLSDLGGSVPGFGDHIALTIHNIGSSFMEVVGRYFVRHIDEGSNKEWLVWFVVVEPVKLPEADDLFDLISDTYNRFAKTRPALRRERMPLLDSPAVDGNQSYFKRWEEQDDERKKRGPVHRLDKPQMRALRFLAGHPDITTVDLIPQCGEKTMEALANVGCTRPGGKDHRGRQEWHITGEGRAEIERDDIYQNWVFE
ncbi:hypothetical protein HRR99_05840 [Agrobacterium vaccinii]|uniref:hypothetical protein n=1 Tax=Agrobacterium vaccinii TaxID=2735528 RepID=UPI001E375256|nr:hypothetical protein [Agrobacterium vaccinii]UHS61069.1 hypothetical protein HRR99_05840 [Agrobacterium vaccinii]